MVVKKFCLTCNFKKSGFSYILCVFFCVFSHTRDVPELSATMYGIQDNEDISDVQSIVNAGKKLATAQCLLDALENIYCGSMSVEFMHMKVIFATK